MWLLTPLNWHGTPFVHFIMFWPQQQWLNTRYMYNGRFHIGEGSHLRYWLCKIDMDSRCRLSNFICNVNVYHNTSKGLTEIGELQGVSPIESNIQGKKLCNMKWEWSEVDARGMEWRICIYNVQLQKSRIASFRDA